MDALLIWAEERNKEYRKLWLKYRKEEKTTSVSFQGRSLNELLVCVVSISLNCSNYIDRIILVCRDDGERVQKGLISLLGDLSLPIVYINQKSCFSCMEGLLPCFSELAIKTLAYRIPCLSEDFVYFDSGTVAIRKCLLTVSESKSVLYSPMILNKKNLENYLVSNPGLLAENLKYRFDSPKQVDVMRHCASGLQGTSTRVLVPGEDRKFVSDLKDCENCDFIHYPPLANFSHEQARALTDWLCAKLKTKI